MANLITALAVAGCRKSDGSACASGFVFLYSPGTTNPVLGYKDDGLTQPWSTVNGGIQLDAGGRANIWVAGRVDVVVTDASGTVVSSMLGFNGTTANAVEVQNAGYSGAITDPATGAVTQGAGGLTDLDTLLTRAKTSFGGLDFQFLESGGATPRKYVDVINEFGVSVKSFGAVGNNIGDDTIACQNAITEAQRLGFATVTFPPGTYKLTSALLVTTAIKLQGAQNGSSIISQTSGSANGITISGAGTVAMSNLAIVSPGGSTGTALALVNSSIDMSSCALGGGGGFARGITTSTSGGSRIRDSFVAGSSFGIQLIDHASGTWISNCQFSGGGGTVLEIQASTTNLMVSGCYFFAGAAKGISFNANLGVGTYHTFIGCPSLGASGAITTPIDTSALPHAVLVRQFGNNTDSVSGSVATGGTFTPVIVVADVIVITATGGAGTASVASPAFFFNPEQNRLIRFRFINGAGGAVTWSLNAIYRLAGGVAIPGTDGHTVEVVFVYDVAAGRMREVSRSDTVT